MMLSCFDYTIVHIKGEDTCWADLLSRWGARSEPTPKEYRKGQQSHLQLAALFRASLAPIHDHEYTWPDAAKIAHAKKVVTKKDHRKHKLKKSNGLLVTHNGTV